MDDRDPNGAHSRPVGKSKGVWVFGAILLGIVIIAGIWGFVYAGSGTDHDRIANTVADAPDV
jgi:hypothetical protein